MSAGLCTVSRGVRRAGFCNLTTHDSCFSVCALPPAATTRRMYAVTAASYTRWCLSEGEGRARRVGADDAAAACVGGH
jgi:hypothetical protein